MYQIRSFLHRCAPQWWLRQRVKKLYSSLENRSDKDYILNRVDYYCKSLPHAQVHPIHGDFQLRTMGFGQSLRTYYRDFFEYSRFFNPELRVDCEFGDNTIIPNTPSITKSRPIQNNNENCVLLKLDKVRHFIFLNDKNQFKDKANKAIFRGIACQPHRIAFMEKYFGSDWVDCGDTSVNPMVSAWKVPLITLYDHLKYKFIISLEGNDVASNLKWVMSSNSVAVMPKPKFETWFMEGTLIPNYHYIEIKDDYSDLPEKLAYYIEHPEEAEAISRNANAYVEQFKDKDREDLIHLLVLEKYFKNTNPNIAVFR